MTDGGVEEACRLYCAVVTYRRSALLVPVLQRIAEQTRAPDLLIVIDNSPSTTTEAAVAEYRSHGHDALYIAAPENTGPAGGTALAMEAALERGEDRDWIIRVDDDRGPIDPDLFRDMESFALEMFDRDSQTAGVGLVGARYSWRKGRLLRVPESELEGAVKVDYLATNHFPLFRLSAVREVGPFRSDLFFGSSEVEYGLRLRNRGFRLYAHGDRWLPMRSERTDPLHPRLNVTAPNWRRYYSLRNQLFVLRSYGYSSTAIRIAVVRGILKPLANLPFAPRVAMQNLRLNVRAIRDGWSGRLGRTLEPNDAALDPLDPNCDQPGSD